MEETETNYVGIGPYTKGEWKRNGFTVYCVNPHEFGKNLEGVAAGQDIREVSWFYTTIYGLPDTPSSQLKANAELMRRAPQLLEGCKKALTCADLPDSVKEVIRQAIEGTLPL